MADAKSTYLIDLQVRTAGVEAAFAKMGAAARQAISVPATVTVPSATPQGVGQARGELRALYERQQAKALVPYGTPLSATRLKDIQDLANRQVPLPPGSNKAARDAAQKASDAALIRDRGIFQKSELVGRKALDYLDVYDKNATETYALAQQEQRARNKTAEDARRLERKRQDGIQRATAKLGNAEDRLTSSMGVAQAAMDQGLIPSQLVKAGELGPVKIVNEAGAHEQAVKQKAAFDKKAAATQRQADAEVKRAALAQRALDEENPYYLASKRLRENKLRREANILYHQALTGADFKDVAYERLLTEKTARGVDKEYIKQISPAEILEQGQVNAGLNSIRKRIIAEEQRVLAADAAYITATASAAANKKLIAARAAIEQVPLDRENLPVLAEAGAKKKIAAAQLAAAEHKLTSTNHEMIKAKASTIVSEKEYAAALRKAVKQEARERGVGGGGFFGSGGGGFGGGGGTGIPQTGREFFGRGFRSVAQYGLPSALAYGSFRILKEGLTSAVALEREFALLQGQFDATFGASAAPKLKAFKDHIFDIATSTGVASEELSHIGLQLQGALYREQGITDSSSGAGKVDLSGQDLVNKQLEDAAKVAVVTGLSAAEITDSLTAATLGFRRSAGDVGDIALRLQDRTGVLAKETIKFIGDIAPVAQEAGFSLEEMSSIAALAQQRSGRAGASLAEAFGRIIPQISQSKAELLQFAEVNKSFDNPRFLQAVAQSDVKEILKQVAQNFDGLNAGSREFIVNLLGGRREANALLAVFRGGNLQETIDDLINAPGNLESKFKQLSGTLAVQFNKLKEIFKILTVELLNGGLLDAIKGAVAGLAAFGTTITTTMGILGPLLGVMDGAILKFAGFAAAVYYLNKALLVLIATQKIQLALSVLTRGAGAAGVVGKVSKAAVATQVGADLLPVAASTITGGAAKGAVTGASMVPIVAVAAVLVGAAILQYKATQDKQEKTFKETYEKGVADFAKAAETESAAELQASYEAALADQKAHPGAGFFRTHFTISRNIPKQGNAEAKSEIEAYQKYVTEQTFGTVVNAINLSSEDLIKDITKNQDVRKDLKSAGFNFDKKLEPSYLKDILDRAATGNEKERKQANLWLQILTDHTAELGSLTRQSVADALSGAGVSFQDTISKYEAGDVGFEAVTAAFEAKQKINAEALKLAKLPKVRSGLPGTADAGAAGAELPDVSQINKANAEEIKKYLETLKGRTERLRAQAEAGQITPGELYAAITAQIKQQQLAVNSLLASGSTGDQQLTQLANEIKLQKQTYAQMVDNFDSLTDELRALSTGSEEDSSEGVQGSIDAQLAKLADPEYSDKTARLGTAKKLLGLLKKQREIEASTAETVEERNRIMNEERPVDPAILAVIADGLVDFSPGWQQLTGILKGAYFHISQSAIRDMVLAVHFNKSAKAIAIASINATKTSIGNLINQMNDPGLADQLGINDSYNDAAADAAAVEAAFEKALTDLEKGMASFDNGNVSFKGGGGGGGEDLAKKAEEEAKALLTAQDNFFTALLEGDPVRAARRELDRAHYAIAVAATEVERLNGEAQKVRAERALEAAINDIGQARVDLLLAYAEAAHDTVEVAKINAKKATDELARTRELYATGGAGEADVNRAEANKIRADAAERDAIISKQREDAQFLFDMGKITKQQFRQLLVNLLNTALLPEDIARDLQRQIKQLDDALGGDSQLNLPTFLKLPTLYEARRITQQGGGSGGGVTGFGNELNSTGYTDNRNIAITLYVNNGTTQAQMTDLLMNVVGTNRVSYANRSY